MMRCCETDRCMEHVSDETGEKPQTMCRRNMLVRTRKIWPMHCRSCAGLFLCFLLFCSHAPYATGCDVWDVKRDNGISDHAMSGACWCEQKKMTNGSWKMHSFICCVFFLFCFVFWHVPCACCETVFMWTERDAKRDALTSVAWKRCRNKCMNTESALGRVWKNMWVRNSAESDIMSNTPGMLLCGAALEKLRAKKHEDDTMIA